jgi:bifunctional enzyme CysN/CysC
MLADTGSLPDGKLEQVKKNCEINSRPFEYAFLLDALKDEQSQGITIDTARVFFKTEKRDYIILDAPGHIEFLKNMVTGASHAEAALLVIDAEEGIRENSMRHGYMLGMLGIRKIVVVVNKMDLVDYNEDIYNDIVKNYTAFLNSINIEPATFIPASGMMGDNIANRSQNMKWYDGITVLESLDRFESDPPVEDMPFRMPVTDVYKFTRYGDNRRIVAGTIESGKIAVGDRVVFYPSGKSSKISGIVGFNTPERDEIGVGYSTGLTLDEQIYITRGELAFKDGEEKPLVSSRILASVFWLGHEAMTTKKEYHLKLGTAKLPVKLEKIVRTIDTSDLDADSQKESIERHDVAECILRLKKPIAFDTVDRFQDTGRFVIVDDYNIRGGGIIRDRLEDDQSAIREKVYLRNLKWIKTDINHLERAEKYNQRATLIIITGKPGTGRKDLARGLEARLFADGKFVYYLGLGSVLYGVDSDLKNEKNDPEHIRRFAEIAHILLDTGLIAIVTAQELSQDELEIIKASVSPDMLEVVWTGADITTDIAYDMHIENSHNTEEAVEKLKLMLQERGAIFKVL